ncbi:MAG: hypothetical protein ACLQVM_16355, partial [Terriglobia bacterium]
GKKAINPKPDNTDPPSFLLLARNLPSATLICHGSFIELLTEATLDGTPKAGHGVSRVVGRT